MIIIPFYSWGDRFRVTWLFCGLHLALRQRIWPGACVLSCQPGSIQDGSKSVGERAMGLAECCLWVLLCTSLEGWLRLPALSPVGLPRTTTSIGSSRGAKWQAHSMGWESARLTSCVNWLTTELTKILEGAPEFEFCKPRCTLAQLQEEEWEQCFRDHAFPWNLSTITRKKKMCGVGGHGEDLEDSKLNKMWKLLYGLSMSRLSMWEKYAIYIGHLLDWCLFPASCRHLSRPPCPDDKA